MAHSETKAHSPAYPAESNAGGKYMGLTKLEEFASRNHAALLAAGLNNQGEASQKATANIALQNALALIDALNDYNVNS
ncbi:MAG: hypothetical protein AAGI24_04080 [Pseudomonadota bacterium]